MKRTKQPTAAVIALLLLCSLLILLAGCAGNPFRPNSPGAKEPVSLSAWIAYWDIPAGESDFRRIDEKLQKLSYFAASFNQDDQLFVPEELTALRNKHKQEKVKTEAYLTFVNDKAGADGSSLLKDTEVLRRRLADDAAIDRHIAEIIELTLQQGYDGIEIDYERVWRDEFVRQVFPSFINKLYLAALKQNIPLRVVLEPGTPFQDAAFAKGPEYVVMLYNLYGLHSGPGPKADKAFIRQTIGRMAALPGQKSVALATGGASWGSNGEKKFITEQEAKTLAVTFDIEPVRDEASQCLVFQYTNAGVSYQVWYADAKTLHYWTTIAQEQGISNISLWRLGGNLDLHKLK